MPSSKYQKNKRINRQKQNQQYMSESSDQSQNQQQQKKLNNNQSNNIQVQPSIQFGDNSIQMKCPFCLQNIRSEIILKPEFISIIFGFSLFIIFPHILTLLLTIIVLQITSTRKHRCPLCQRQLGSDGKFLVFFKDQVYSFAFGANGIIISKKIIASIGIGLFVFLILYIKMSSLGPQIQFTDLTWPQFIRQCPWDSADKKCTRQNQGLTVKNWQGFVMRVQDNRNSYRKHFDYAVSLYVKMNNDQSLQINKQKPDIFLTINNYQAHIWQQTLDNLSHGDKIIFNATFEYLRNNRGIPFGRHLNVVDLNRTGIKNNNIHVYMSQDQDLLFFNNLSGQKLRKYQNQQNKNQQNKLQQIKKQQIKIKKQDVLNDIKKQQKQKINQVELKSDQINIKQIQLNHIQQGIKQTIIKNEQK